MQRLKELHKFTVTDTFMEIGEDIREIRSEDENEENPVEIDDTKEEELVEIDARPAVKLKASKPKLGHGQVDRFGVRHGYQGQSTRRRSKKVLANTQFSEEENDALMYGHFVEKRSSRSMAEHMGRPAIDVIKRVDQFSNRSRALNIKRKRVLKSFSVFPSSTKPVPKTVYQFYTARAKQNISSEPCRFSELSLAEQSMWKMEFVKAKARYFRLVQESIQESPHSQALWEELRRLEIPHQFIVRGTTYDQGKVVKRRHYSGLVKYQADPFQFFKENFKAELVERIHLHEAHESVQSWAFLKKSAPGTFPTKPIEITGTKCDF